jgi:hypothetical protein
MTVSQLKSLSSSVNIMYTAEKALMSLPSPLTVSDEYIRYRDGPTENVKVTAGLHRQVWVSGTNIFVDIKIANNAKKPIKRLELHLERDILCYKHVCFCKGKDQRWLTKSIGCRINVREECNSVENI